MSLTSGVVGGGLATLLLGAGKAGAGPAADALVADATPEALRAEAFALLRTAQNVGAGLGPFLGALLAEKAPHLLFAAAGLLVALLLLVPPILPEMLPERTRRETARLRPLPPFGTGVGLLFMATLLEHGGYQVVETILPAHLAALRPDALGLSPWLAAVNTGLVVLLQLPLARLLARRPPLLGPVAGCLLMGLSYLPFARQVSRSCR